MTFEAHPSGPENQSGYCTVYINDQTWAVLGGKGADLTCPSVRGKHMRLKRAFWSVIALCLVVVGGMVLVGKGTTLGSRPAKAPPLMSAYTNLTDFWHEAAASLEIQPETGLLKQWNIGYGPGGEVLYQSVTLYVDRGPGAYDVFHYSQDSRNEELGRSEARWSRQRMKGSVPRGLVPAHKVFAAVNQVGLRELENDQELEPPVRFWFIAGSGLKTSGAAGGYLIADGHITPIGPDGVTIHGEYGTLGIAEGAVSTTGGVQTASTGNPESPRFLLPLSSH